MDNICVTEHERIILHVIENFFNKFDDVEK